MSRISRPIEEIGSHYDVVVVGSGYGGGIAASRLARAGRRVCLLERGRELQPGEYPETELEGLREMQVDLPGRHVGSETGLYDLRVNDDINVFVGCGLGGTSLVNANVSLRADERVFRDVRWPRALREDVQGREEGYRLAEEMLRPTPYPERAPELKKLAAHEKSAQKFPGATFSRPPLNVTFDALPSDRNHVGVEQHPCVHCGDCVSGCNYGAKNTVLMNYLPDACNHGAEIFTEAAVRFVERDGERWLVHYELLRSGRERFGAALLRVEADLVVLAAGTLGSTEILLRSRARGLAVSDVLGERFTGNGDVLGFAYNCDQEINGIGWGHLDPEERDPVGPCITGLIDGRATDQLEDGTVFEEGSMPGPISALLPPIFAASSKLTGRDTDPGLVDEVREQGRELDGLVRGAYHGAMQNTQTYLVMAHDDGQGRMALDEHDRLRVEWRNVGQQPIFRRINRILRDATESLGGTFVPNPVWNSLMGHDLVTVHPLGGCVMGENAESGVVNHKAQVFSGTAGDAVYDGLYVCDGSIVPRPLGVNPLLTISALAERNCARLLEDRGWPLRTELPSSPPAEARAGRPGVRFTESMKGHFSTEEADDHRRAAARGRETDSPFQFVLTIISDDVERMIDDPRHEARMVGTVTAPALSADPLMATEGRFNLFVEDDEAVATRRMLYAMKLSGAARGPLYFEGFKTIHQDRGPDLWSDTTTIYITVYEGDDDTGAVVGKGVLEILPEDFMRQLTTMEITDAASPLERLRLLARFGQFFGGVLYQTYGGVVATPNVFDPGAPPRRRRQLRAGNPEVHFFDARDGQRLRLTRHRGGDRGPVMLAHGLGVSSRIFSIDTIDTNLVEFLYAHGFDVWLLDYRSSIELPAAQTQHSADQVATIDYPEAVARVRALTRADDIQVVAHCFGSTTFVMAMLAGLQGVRSAVCSQIATHVRVPVLTRLKSGLHLAQFLDALGVNELSAYVDANANWLEQLYDRALGAFPVELEERCNSAVCHRITFMYALLYEHDQLNRATHDALHEMFGIANITAFEHLGRLVREGQLVDASGRDVYMPHLDRLAIPICFIHGAENACFNPESTEITYNVLREKNGKGLYSRHVIPNYGHIDCIFGKNAARDVYPLMLQHLEEGA